VIFSAVQSNLKLESAPLSLSLLLSLELADPSDHEARPGNRPRNSDLAWFLRFRRKSLAGNRIRFAATNSVAGDYYDAFFRPLRSGWWQTDAGLRRAGKSIPAAL